MVIGQLTNFPMYLLIELKPIYLLVMKHYTLHDQEISQIVLDFFNQSLQDSSGHSRM